ncbi:MAG TPA: preprotein translocase subunit SecG, partial [Tepidisphaeraceae bacterium]|nr:preprotein translocase subunit SecG [Tepidisphaeraceae bacterium]
MNTSFYLLLVAFLVLCLFMCGLILIQRGRGGGLASGFGGAGANTAFGSKTGDVLTWTTAIVFAVFVAMTIGLNMMAERIHNGRRPAAVVTQVVPTSTT